MNDLFNPSAPWCFSDRTQRLVGGVRASVRHVSKSATAAGIKHALAREGCEAPSFEFLGYVELDADVRGDAEMVFVSGTLFTRSPMEHTVRPSMCACVFSFLFVFLTSTRVLPHVDCHDRHGYFSLTVYGQCVNLLTLRS